MWARGPAHPSDKSTFHFRASMVGTGFRPAKGDATMGSWRRQLRFDPVPALLGSEDEALGHFVRRDLCEEDVGPVCRLWRLPGAQRILRKQQPDGSWDRSVSQKKHEAINYGLIETWKQFRFLVEVHGFNREDSSTARAAEFIFSCQTEDGDIRGMLANQYAAYYTGALLSLLIKAGYEDDPRIENGFRWLLSMRQDDLGWSEALITLDLSRATLYRLTSQVAEPVVPDRSRPFSHNSTGMVLRAFAAHSRHRRSEAARTAAKLQSRGSFGRIRIRPTRQQATGCGSNTLSGGTALLPHLIPFRSSTPQGMSRWRRRSPGSLATKRKTVSGKHRTPTTKNRTMPRQWRPGCG